MRTAVIAVIAAAVMIAASIGAVALIHHENDGSEEVYGIVVAKIGRASCRERVYSGV